MQRFNEVLVIHIQVNKLAKLQQRHPPLSLDLRPAKTSYFNHLASLPLSDSAFFFLDGLPSDSGNCEERGGDWGGEQIKWFTLMSPVNSILPINK